MASGSRLKIGRFPIKKTGEKTLQQKNQDRLKKYMFPLLFLVIISVTLNPLWAQDDLRIKYAQSLERTGSYQEALDIYLALFGKGNEEPAVINGISNCYQQLQQYENLENFLKSALQKDPDQLQFKIFYGSALYLNNKEAQAQQVWQDVCSAQPPNIMNYRFVASEMIDLRLYKSAIDIYKTAIRTFPKQEALHRDIGALYRALLDYEQAVENLLLFSSYYPNQLGYTRSQIIAMSKDDEAGSRIISAIENYMRSHKAEAPIEEIIASLYLKKKEYDKAFAIYHRLHSENKTQNYLAQFAREAQAQGVYDFAIKACQLLLNDKISDNLRMNYQMQLAENYYQLGKQLSVKSSDGQGQLHVRDALKLLRALSANTSAPAVAWQSLERLGDIHLEYYNDIDQTINFYSSVLKIRAAYDILDRIYIKLGNAYLLKNETSAANDYYKQVRNKEQRKIADFNRAEIVFYNGLFTKAKTQYDQLLNSIAMRDTVTNNALQRIMLIEQFGSDSTLLAKFSAAEFLDRQNKHSEAAREFEEIFSKRREISPFAGEKCATLLLQLNKTNEAEKILKALIDDYPDYRNTDKVYFLLAETYSKRQAFDLALESFKKILIDFPGSFYFEDARQRARQLSEAAKESKLP